MDEVGPLASRAQGPVSPNGDMRAVTSPEIVPADRAEGEAQRSSSPGGVESSRTSAVATSVVQRCRWSAASRSRTTSACRGCSARNTATAPGRGSSR